MEKSKSLAGFIGPIVIVIVVLLSEAQTAKEPVKNVGLDFSENRQSVRSQ
jgi:hypothetical protein